MRDIAVPKDLHTSVGYSLKQSRHDALRNIAKAKKTNNASAIVQEAVEIWLRLEYGSDWMETLDDQLARESAYRKLKAEFKRESEYLREEGVA